MPFNNENEARHAGKAWALLILVLVAVLAVKAPGALVALGVGVTAILYGLGRIIGLLFGA